MKGLSKVLVTSSFIGSLIFSSVLSSNVLASSSLNCSKEAVKPKLEKILFVTEEVKSRAQLLLFESNRIRLGDIDFCEVVYSVEDPQVEPNMRKLKFVGYLRDDLFISGDIRFFDQKENRLKFVSQEKFFAVNKGLFDEIREQEAHGREKLSDIKFFENKADITLGVLTENTKYDIYVFIDPRCPYCVRIIDYFDRKLSERKDLRVNYIATPVLGEDSKKVSISVLCDVKDPKERLAKLKERHMSKDPCPLGQKKIESNIALFNDLGFRGVPVSIIYKKDESGKFVLLDVVNGANIPLLERLIN